MFGMKACISSVAAVMLTEHPAVASGPKHPLPGQRRMTIGAPPKAAPPPSHPGADMQPTSETDRTRAADAAPVPHFTPVPPMARPDHNWLNRWPLRSYLELGALDIAPGSARAHVGAVV